MRKLKAIILVGGEGTRLRPLTFSQPKAVVPLINQPFLWFQLDLLKRYGVKDIFLTSYYLMSKIKKILGDGSAFGVRLFYSMEKFPMGTAGGVGQLKNKFNPDDLLIILNGDVLTDFNIGDIISYHLNKKSMATIVLTQVSNPSRYGLVILEKDGRVKEFREKPSQEEIVGNLVNAGIYILEARLLDFIPEGVNFSFERQFFPLLLQKNIPFFGYHSNRQGKAYSYWLDIGLPEKYLEAQADILNKKIKFQPKGEKRGKDIFVEKNTRISPKAKLRGPLVIGSDCVIEDNVELGENVVIGDGCQILAGAKLSNCLLWSGVVVGQKAILSGCILADKIRVGDNAHIGSGIILGAGTKITKFSILNRK